MTPALLIMLAWAAALVLSPAAVILHLVRHGTRRLWLAFLCPLGALLTFGIVSAAIGMAESSWSWGSRGLLFAAAVGVLGIALQVIGWRAVLRRRPGPGACRACGYDLRGMARCPECGKPRVQDRRRQACSLTPAGSRASGAAPCTRPRCHRRSWSRG